MLLHALDRRDNAIIVKIEEEVYRNLLKTKTGAELADAVKSAWTVVDNDPRVSDLDDADVFFSCNDVCNGYVSSSELLSELDDFTG